MSSEPENASELGPEAREAVHQLRDGIARAQVIMREAKQAIGHHAPEGALLPPDPEDELTDEAPAEPPIQSRS